VVRDGDILREPCGHILSLTDFGETGIETELQAYFDRYFTLKLKHFKLHTALLGNHSRPRRETRFTWKDVA